MGWGEGGRGGRVVGAAVCCVCAKTIGCVGGVRALLLTERASRSLFAAAGVCLLWLPATAGSTTTTYVGSSGGVICTIKSSCRRRDGHMTCAHSYQSSGTECSNTLQGVYDTCTKPTTPKDPTVNKAIKRALTSLSQPSHMRRSCPYHAERVIASRKNPTPCDRIQNVKHHRWRCL